MDWGPLAPHIMIIIRAANDEDSTLNEILQTVQLEYVEYPNDVPTFP